MPAGIRLRGAVGQQIPTTGQEVAMEHECSAKLERTVRAPGLARDMVTSFLADWKLDDLISVAALLMSELVTNSYQHADGPIDVHVRWAGEVLRVEVHDDSPELARLRPPNGGGRGLQLVTAFATAWGSLSRNNGKVTWFELQRD